MGSLASRAVLVAVGNAVFVALGALPLGCAVGGEVSDETMLAAALREEAQGAAENQGGMGPVGDNHLALPTRDPNMVNPDPVPVASEGEPEPLAPAPQPSSPTPTPPSNAPGSGGSGGDAPRPVFTPPNTPAGGTSAGGAAPEPEPLAEPAVEPEPAVVPEPVAEPAAEPEPAPFPQFPFPQPQPEPTPEPATEPTAPAPEPAVPEPEPAPAPAPGNCRTLAKGVSSGPIEVEEVCFTVMGPIAGWQASGLENGGRTITVNGTQVTSGAALPDVPTYTFVFSAGEPAWVAWNYW